MSCSKVAEIYRLLLSTVNILLGRLRGVRQTEASLIYGVESEATVGSSVESEAQ